MQHCVEIAEDFQSGAKGLQELISTFSDQGLDLLRGWRQRELVDELHSSSPENLYNRVSILGVDMSDAVISDVKEFFTSNGKH
jgi:hypothetical protein